MAYYINIWREKNLVVRKAYEDDFGRWISEHEYMVAIETDDGRLLQFPVMASDYLRDYTADEYLKEIEDEDVRVLLPYDCPARDCDIKQNITEWICNECCVSGGTVIDAICEVVSLLTRYGMWKDMYSKSIDMKKIRRNAEMNDRNELLDSLKVREKAVMPELDLMRYAEDPSHMEYQPCCGDCCWFYGEDADGNGSCALHRYDGDELPWYNESSFACQDITTRREMRHHMAVLLREKRWQVRTGDFDSGKISIPPQKEDVIRAIGFAYRYMKVYSKQ